MYTLVSIAWKHCYLYCLFYLGKFAHISGDYLGTFVHPHFDANFFHDRRTNFAVLYGIWKISQKVQDFCLDFLENQLISQIGWKDQGILRKKLHFLAADQFDQLIKSIDQNIKKCFLFKNIFWKKSFFYQLTDQLIQKSARSDQEKTSFFSIWSVRSSDQISWSEY